jgi:8-oxo-dGTP pyrophosphatase MutT (NUDIX family)
MTHTIDGVAAATKRCDNTSVGILIQDDQGRLLVFNRATLPWGVAPPAGHIDDHGTPEQAATAEVHEEVGLQVEDLELVARRWRDNRCRRADGPQAEPGIEPVWVLFLSMAGLITAHREDLAAIEDIAAGQVRA